MCVCVCVCAREYPYITSELGNPAPTSPPLTDANPNPEQVVQPLVTATADTTFIDSNPTTVNTTVSNTSAEFNLSQYLTLRHSSHSTSLRPSTSASTESPIRPWTPTPALQGSILPSYPVKFTWIWHEPTCLPPTFPAGGTHQQRKWIYHHQVTLYPHRPTRLRPTTHHRI